MADHLGQRLLSNAAGDVDALRAGCLSIA